MVFISYNFWQWLELFSCQLYTCITFGIFMLFSSLDSFFFIVFIKKKSQRHLRVLLSKFIEAHCRTHKGKTK